MSMEPKNLVSRIKQKSKQYSWYYDSPACRLHEFNPQPTRQCDVQIKRVYHKPEKSDGFRVLVDRIWPRGVTKRGAALDEWLHNLAPSSRLRKWFGHDPQRWSEFRERYRAELVQSAPVLHALRERAARQRLTLLYGAIDPQFNHAVVLEEVIRE